MRVPLSWLRDYVDVQLNPEQLAERLTLLGMEVKSIERWGSDWQNVVVGGVQRVNMPIDAVIQPHRPRPGGLPILIEAKSAGDFTNTNKRRKEEAQKIRQLKEEYGDEVDLLLFLCGYFDTGYLGYEAAEGLDWVWEHRIDDLADAGI